MKLYIKHKTDSRCKMTVQAALEKLSLPYRMMGLGVVEIKVYFTPRQLDQLEIILLKYGFELMDGKKARLIEKIKNAVSRTVDHPDNAHKINFSGYLGGQLKCDYAYLDKLFLESTGTTIEQYLITLKIERVKELLLCDRLNLTRIACKLNYTSVRHLSNQFMEMTGMTPALFRQVRYN